MGYDDLELWALQGNDFQVVSYQEGLHPPLRLLNGLVEEVGDLCEVRAGGHTSELDPEPPGHEIPVSAGLQEAQVVLRRSEGAGAPIEGLSQLE